MVFQTVGLVDMREQAVAEYREAYRQEEIPANYRGLVHLCFTFASGIAVVIYSAWQLDQVQAAQWLTIPITLLYANLAEYLGHRFVMHRPVPGLGLLYKRHSGQHHRFFSHQHMELDGIRDLKVVLFPPVLMVFFVLAFALPVGIALSWLFAGNVGFLFAATAVAYFLNYEILHLAYHLPRDSWLGRRGLVSRLRALHTSHHDPRLMSNWNFNITYPVSDLLFRTFRGSAASRADPPAASTY